ncbi:MAG: hypothetical protein R2932_23325 [Caldilineaceae bacterium]
MNAIALDVAKAAGFYPSDFYLQRCPVHQQVVEGDIVKVGGLELQAWDTPGHRDGHLSFLFRGRDRAICLAVISSFTWAGCVAEYPRLPH